MTLTLPSAARFYLHVLGHAFAMHWPRGLLKRVKELVSYIYMKDNQKKGKCVCLKAINPLRSCARHSACVLRLIVHRPKE
jgi:hypothetical protein